MLFRSLDAIRQAFALIADASVKARQSGLGGRLKIHSAPVFAERWLVPRCGQLQDLLPNLELSILPQRDPQGDSTDDADIWIQYGQDDWGNRWSSRLVTLKLFPACSPRLLNSANPLRDAVDLARAHLLHEDDGREWGRWFDATGTTVAAGERGTYFYNTGLTAVAAAHGQGVALVDNITAADDLASGRLVRIGDADIPASGSYYVIARPERMRSPTIRTAIDWLVAQFP